jgi:hypothetical protein
MRHLPLASLAILASAAACYSHFPAGGPHYYGAWTSHVVPVEPSQPIARGEALGRPVFYEAYFDKDGRIVRFVEYANGNARAETRYVYRADASFEERHCHERTLLVSVHANGKETSSSTVRGGCTIAP